MSWPTASFKEVAAVVTGSTPEKNQDNYGGHIPFVTPGDLGQHSEVSQAKVTLTDEGAKSGRLLPANSVLVCCIGATIGKTGIAATPVVTNQQINSLIFDESKVFPKYAYYFCSTLTPFLLHRSSSTTMPIVNKSSFSEIEIPLPPLEEQKRIAAILDKADAIRRKRQQAIKLADDFLRSVFLEMFGDPVTNPKGWEVKPLIDLCSEKMQNGAYFPKECYADNGIEMVHMSDAFYDTVQRGSLKRVICSHEDVERYNLNENQLLISRRSLTYEGAAKPSLIPRSTEPLIFESSLIRVCPSQDKILARFLFQYLSTESVKEQHVRKYVTGATIKGISQKNLEKISVYVPPMSLQERFVAKVRKINDLTQKASLHSVVVSKLFESLSQKAFSGQL